jgi:methionine-rich copper-binding protein CopC
MAMLGGLLLVGTAFAHAAYLRSVPGENGVVSSPPTRVDIWFTQELFRRQGENRIEVFDPDGQPVHAGEAEVDNDDRTHLWVELLSDLAPGTYRVEWRSLSAEDGDNDAGEFSFTFDPQAEVTSTPMGAESPGAPTEGPETGQLTASPRPSPDAGMTPTPPRTNATPQDLHQAHTPQVAPTEPGSPGNRCLLGLIPVAGLMGTAWILRQRGSISI